MERDFGVGYDLDETDLLPKCRRVVFRQAHNLGADFLQVVFPQALPTAGRIGSAAPVMSGLSLSFLGRSTVVRAADAATDSGGEFRMLIRVGKIVLYPRPLAVFVLIRPAVALGCRCPFKCFFFAVFENVAKLLSVQNVDVVDTVSKNILIKFIQFEGFFYLWLGKSWNL